MVQSAHRVLAVLTAAAALLVLLTGITQVAVRHLGQATVATATAPRTPVIAAIEARRSKFDRLVIKVADLGKQDILAANAKSDLEIVPPIDTVERLQMASVRIDETSYTASPAPSIVEPGSEPVMSSPARVELSAGDLDAANVFIHGIIAGEEQFGSSTTSDGLGGVLN